MSVENSIGDALAFALTLPTEPRELAALGASTVVNDWSTGQWAIYSGFLGAALVEATDKLENR